MGNNLISRIVRINNLNIVNLTLDDTGETLRVLTVRKRSGKLTILNTAEYADFESFSKGTGVKLPVVLVIDGNGILNKKINFNDQADVTWYKNIDFKTIFYTSLKSAKSDFISFCRKSIVDASAARFKEAGFHLVDTYLGAFPAALVKPSIAGQTVTAGNLLLHFDDNSLTDFNKVPSKQVVLYQIGDDSVSSEMLPSYGAMLHFFLQNKEIEKTEVATLESEELLYKKAFQVLGTFMLSFFFLLLLASYLLTGHYMAENAELNLEKVYSGETYKKILDLEAQKQDKLKILQESGFKANKFYSYYGYELIKMAPGDLSLMQLNLSPVKNDIRPEKKVTLESGVIIAKGLCDDESSLNKWLLALKDTRWVSNFEIVSVKKDKKGNSVFEIKIIVNRDV